jgi:hypothetical protein
MRPLPPSRQTTTISETTIRPHLNQALDVKRDLFAQVTLDRSLVFEKRSNLIHFVLREVGDLTIRVDTDTVQNRLRTGTANSVNIGETNLSPLLCGKIDAGYTCHRLGSPVVLK